MDWNEYADWLARLVMDGVLTEEEAVALAASGIKLDGSTAPLRPSAAITDTGDDHAAEATALLLGLLGFSNGPAPWMPNQRYRALNTLEAAFLAQVRDLAGGLLDGTYTLGQWQRETAVLLRSHHLMLAQAARGRYRLSRAELTAVRDAVRIEQAFLSRFADQLAYRRMNGSDWTSAGLVERLRLYLGNPRGTFYREVETSMVDDGYYGAGWVVYYEALDDPATCSPCHEAQGYYLPGEGPMPGQVCQGRSRCRCKRRLRYRPDIYESLTKP